MLAVMHGKTGCVEKLIHAGANVCYAFIFVYIYIFTRFQITVAAPLQL
jgi:preprotein translocase subunit SecF